MNEKQSTNSTGPSEKSNDDSAGFIGYSASMAVIALCHYFNVLPVFVSDVFGLLAWCQFALMVIGVLLMIYAIWFSNGVVHGRIKADQDTVHLMSKAHKSLNSIDWNFLFWALLTIPGLTFLAGYERAAQAMWIVEFGFLLIRLLMHEPNRAKK